MEKVTIKDVAKHAGVGVGTVSSVLNKSRNVSPKLKRKIEESIEALGYYPDMLAHNLRRQRNYTVVFFVNDISNVSFSTIAKTIQNELEKYSLSLVLYNTGNEKAEEKIRNTLGSRKFDGAIVSVQDEDKFVLPHNAQGLPLILLDREIRGVTADSVLTDYYHGIRQATEYLIGLGHRRIGIISTNRNIRPSRETVKAFTDALKLHDLICDPGWVKLGDFSEEYGTKATEELVVDHQVTAVIAGSNQLLLGCMEAVRIHGWEVPRDLSIIGFEDTSFTRLMKPGITTVRRPLEHIGKQIAMQMISRLQSNEIHESQNIIIRTELIMRESCISPAQGGLTHENRYYGQ